MLSLQNASFDLEKSHFGEIVLKEEISMDSSKVEAVSQ